MLRVYKIFSIGFLLAGLLTAGESAAQFSFTGQVRTRTELRDGFGAPLQVGQNAAFFTSQRTRLNFGYAGYRTKFFTAIQDVRVWGQDASTNNRITNPAQNGLMVHEAWAEISLLDTNITKTGKDLSLKIGRQELVYDDSRLLGNLDWLQQARRHDAALLKYNHNRFVAHLGVAFNQNSELKSGTLYNGVPTGYPAGTNAIGTMYKSMQFMYLGKQFKAGNASFLVLKDDFNKYSLNETGAKVPAQGTWSRVTVGPYLNTKLGKSISLTASAYLQSGKDKDGANLRAYTYSLSTLYAVNKRFAIGPGVDYLSGNGVGSTGNRRFDPLYGTPHKFWGQMDYFYVADGFGKGGLVDYYLSSIIKVSPRFSIHTDLHEFASATAVMSSDQNRLSRSYGTELDMIMNYTITKTIGLQGGYCTFFTTPTLAAVKGVSNARSNANWAYLMINIKPDFLAKQ
ncbi:alginate export family protein [Telluribacter humicola]|uniref:alginate export family protein n=1 Tax=Telluribacter humicola TaxID=1720261 RepID=UPI001A97CED2|nr:alginate export family protein [Telluribacter humicola]